MVEACGVEVDGDDNLDHHMWNLDLSHSCNLLHQIHTQVQIALVAYDDDKVCSANNKMIGPDGVDRIVGIYV